MSIPLNKKEIFIISSKIVFLELLVESYIMVFLQPVIEDKFDLPPIVEHMFDPLILIMVTTPLIVMWVLKPYIRKRDEIERNLKYLQEQAERSQSEKHELLVAQQSQMQNLMKLTKDLHLSEQRYSLAMSAIQEGIWELNLQDNTLYLSPRWKNIMGFDENGFPNNFLAWAFRIHTDDKSDFISKIAESQKEQDGTSFTCEFRMKHKDGYYIWVSTRWVVRIDEDITKLIGTCSEITNRKKLEARLSYEANHDSLTTLPNRRQLLEKLENSLQRFKNSHDDKFAFLLIDVDKFKLINDTMGHHAGDVLLSNIAQRLRMAIRFEDLVARLGGDEFAIIMDDFGDENNLAPVLERIIGAVRRPLRIEDKTITPNVSIGAVVSGEKHLTRSSQDILMDADLALYQSKEMRRGSYTFFEDDMKDRAAEAFDIVNNMRQALEDGEIEMHYQPVVDFKNDQIVGFESLVRWRHPTRGLLLPGDFLPLIEDTDIVHDLARFSFSKAISDFKAIQASIDRDDLFISVNVSTKQLERNALVDDIDLLMQEFKISGSQLKVEVSESIILKDSEFIGDVIDKLHAKKVKIALDDFGIGNSSLWSLARYQFDTIKIDQSFIADIENNPRYSGMVKMINSLVKSLSVNVVAEGVETAGQLNALKKIGVEKIQGYYFCKPKMLSEILQLIEEKPNPSMWVITKSARRRRKEGSEDQSITA